MERFPDSSRIIEDQEGVAARILFRQAYSHSVAIIFWAVDDPHQSEKPAIVGGSGVLVELKGIPYVVTCEHTIRSFQAMLATDPRYRFQIGGVVINLNERLKDREQTLDLAIIDVSGLDCAQLGLRDDYQLRPLVPTRWPPNPVARSGGLVVVCGFPGGPTREIDVKSHNIVSPGFNFVEHVSDVGADSFLVPFNRATWVTDRNDTAPLATRGLDLGGLSGCPVFTTRTIAGGLLALELLGIVLSEIPLGPDGVFARSVNRISEDGLIIRHTVSEGLGF